MAEYCFSVLGENESLRGGASAAKRRDRIAREVGGNGCGYTYYLDAAKQRYMGWGYCPNKGHPFDAATARAIEDAWKVAGV